MSPHTAVDRGQIYSLKAAFRDDLRVAEAGNRPFGYDPHSYASHHRKQLIGGKLTNFRQLLYSHDLWVAEAGNQPFGYYPYSYASHHRKQLIGGKLTNFRQLLYSDDLWVAEAGNQPFGYDQLSYTSHHRQQLLGSKLTNFRQLLVMTYELPRQKTDQSVTTHAPTQVITGSSWQGAN